MAIGISSENIKLTYSAGESVNVALAGLQEIPSMLGKPSKIDVTCLDDSVKKSIFGVKDLGELQFKFIYDNDSATSNFRVLKGLADAKTLTTFKVGFPDVASTHGTEFEFDAYVNVETDSVAVDKALGFTATFALQSEITVTDPA